jgi:glycosyltransferase involved in cell wall biosynthesis
VTSTIKLDVSVVIPMLNEEESILPLLDEISVSFESLPNCIYEILVVDDGSTDGSAGKVESRSITDNRIQLLRLRRRFGQTAAMAAGIDKSRGKVVITLDADGQNDPHDIPRLLTRMSDGFDCVSGYRMNRKDKFFSRKLPSVIANRIIKRVTNLEIHDFGCTLKAYEGDLLRSIPIYGDMHRLLPFYVSLSGGSITEIPVNHRPRKFGTSKYGIARTFRVINDLLVAKVQGNFFSRPMHLFGNLGLGLLFFALLFVVAAVYLKLTGQRDFIESPLLLISGICVLTGLQVMTTGLLAEIILRRFSFAAREQRYVLRDTC